MSRLLLRSIPLALALAASALAVGCSDDDFGIDSGIHDLSASAGDGGKTGDLASTTPGDLASSTPADLASSTPVDLAPSN